MDFAVFSNVYLEQYFYQEKLIVASYTILA